MFLVWIGVGVIVGATIVPFAPPLFRLAAKIRNWMDFKR